MGGWRSLSLTGIMRPQEAELRKAHTADTITQMHQTSGYGDHELPYTEEDEYVNRGAPFD